MKQTNTKNLILDVAQDLIQRLGVNGMSYQDISERVGIKKASVHTHFPKKNDLLIALLTRFGDRFVRAVDGILATSDSAEVKLRNYCGLFAATLSSGSQDRVCLCGMLGAELATLDDSTLELVRGFYQFNVEKLAILLTLGRQQGSFNFSGDVRAMAYLIFSVLEGAMLVARVEGGVTEFEGAIEQLILLVKGK
jgi:TetR/AcrR family transcriptional regulator, transcriptional repressor for nem operon